jgi:hypothetical protein
MVSNPYFTICNVLKVLLYIWLEISMVYVVGPIVEFWKFVATLALSSRPSKGLQGCEPREKLESEGKCEGMNS